MNQNDQNTYIFDAESIEEMTRLGYQDALFTESMGGFFCEINNDFTGIKRVLDIGCGPGEWVRDLASAHPATQVVGIDISHRMIEFADVQRELQGLDTVQFLVMDATKPLEFPDQHFDLVHARYLEGFLEARLWQEVLAEFWRILAPGGYIHLTESEFFGTSNSHALETLAGLLSTSLKKVGHSLAPASRSNGMIASISTLLRKAGFQNVGITPHILEYSYGTPAYSLMIKDWEIGYRLAFDIFLKTQVATSRDDLKALYTQMLQDFRSPDFQATHDLITVWGKKPL